LHYIINNKLNFKKTMKRHLIFFLLFISIVRTEANPIPIPDAVISELQFRTDGSWILEIAILPVDNIPIEAIWIKSNSGESKLKHFIDDGAEKLLVVENDDLETPLTINFLQDNVVVMLIWDWDTRVSPLLSFGYSNSKIRTPKIGQSIASFYYGYYFSITKSPTIGFPNDTTGMMGTIKGMIYDKDGLPLINMNNIGLVFEESYGLDFFYLQPDGSYSTRYYSYDYINKSRLRYRYGDVFLSVNITPIMFSMQPDSVVIQDIYLTGTIITTGINEINNMESVLKIYPQPVTQQLLNYEIAIPIKSLETYMIFRNINGQEIYRFLVTENKGTIVLPEAIKRGYYIVQLISNKRNYATSKLIIQ